MNQEKLEDLCRQLLTEIGEDPDREGLSGTPRRWAKWWMEFAGYADNNQTTAFTSICNNQLVALTGIRVWTLCEHHLLPFYCDLTIAYLSKTKVVGISKLARMARFHAHRLNVQERLVFDIATAVQNATESESVAVIASGEHLCMSMRGIRTNATMISNDMRGDFLTNAALRMELLAMIGHVQNPF